MNFNAAQLVTSKNASYNDLNHEMKISVQTREVRKFFNDQERWNVHNLIIQYF